MEKINTFLRDGDGLSARDYLMIAFTTPYILAWIVAMIMAFSGVPVSPTTLDLLHSMDGIMMTVVGGVFSVQAVKEFRKPDEVIYQPIEQVEEEDYKNKL